MKGKNSGKEGTVCTEKMEMSRVVLREVNGRMRKCHQGQKDVIRDKTEITQPLYSQLLCMDAEVGQ